MEGINRVYSLITKRFSLFSSTYINLQSSIRVLTDMVFTNAVLINTVLTNYRDKETLLKPMIKMIRYILLRLQADVMLE